MTAVQPPMFTLPIPPGDPGFWGEQPPEPEPPIPPGPTILTSTATPASGMFVSFAVTEDEASNVVKIEWGTDTTYGKEITAGFTGQGTTSQTLPSEDMFEGGYGVGGTTYHFRFVVVGTTPPNDGETVGPDGTWVMIA